jgi:hypothetical protein
VSNNNRQDIVLQNADIFVSIYIAFHLGKCSYAIVADASPHHDTEFAVRSPLHQVRSPPFSTFPPYIYTFVLPNTNLWLVTEYNFTPLVLSCPPPFLPTPCQSFLAHLTKGNVSFCHHLASVVVNFSHFNLLLWNCKANWSEIW